jgi:hypothetical protein
MGIFFGWLILSIFIGIAGKDRRIGGAGAFFCALLLSPLVGLFAVLLSKSLDDDRREKYLAETQRQQAQAMNQMQNAAPKSMVEQLESLLAMKNGGHLTEDEYQTAKAQLIGTQPAPPEPHTPERWRPERERSAPNPS